MVKRVVGLPGDNVKLKGDRLYINKEPVQEDYILKPETTTVKKPHDFGPIAVPELSLFVLGDNRDHSYDSRHFGSVSFNKVIGRVTRIYWSWDGQNNRVRWQRVNKVVK
jgi:signal peptidase I